MADIVKNVQEIEEEEARCPEAGHATGAKQAAERADENEEESCCKVEPECEERSASQEQRQAMVISELVSPTVSVISISSDEVEGAQRHSVGE